MWFTQEIGLDIDSRFAKSRLMYVRLLQASDLLQLQHIGLKCSFVLCGTRSVLESDFRPVVN